jgi:hypothetical protein
VPLNPHKKQLIFCLLACLAVRTTFAQDKAHSPLHSIKPTTDFDQRFYYIPGETQNVWGYRVGVIINDRYKLGIGGYYMNKTVDLAVPSTPLTRTNSDQLTLHKKLYLGTFYYEPYLLRRKLWESSLVFETGYGRTVNNTVDKTNDKIVENNNALLIPAGIGLSVNLKLPPIFHLQCFRWIGINAMGGYRTSIYRQDKQYNYNGAYWSLSGAIFLDRMFEDFHAWKKQRAAARDSRVIELYY